MKTYFDSIARAIRGYKTYAAVVSGSVVEALHYADLLAPREYGILMRVCIGLAVLFFINKVNRGLESMRRSVNWLMRSHK